MTPSRMMLIRSARASTSVRMWLESRIERPRAFSAAISSWKTASISGSSPEVGSSRTSSSTSEASAATMATFAGCPWSSCGPSSSGRARSARAGGRAGPRRGHRGACRAGRSPPAGHPGHRDIAGDIRQPAVQRHGIPPGVAAEEADRAAVRAEQPEDHPDRGRLAGAIGAEQPVHLTGAYLQVEPAQCRERAEPLDQPVDLDGIHHDDNAMAPGPHPQGIRPDS